MEPIKTAMRHNAGISLVVPLICLCLGGLVVLPMINAFSRPASEISEIGAEKNDSSNQSESDEEFLFETIVGVIIARLIFSKFGPINLDFQTACLAPVSPPPKNA